MHNINFLFFLFFLLLKTYNFYNNIIKVSIIVPVYNSESYLNECINSLLSQTLKEIEIILINDGSKDKSLEILNNFALKDSRIIIISKVNNTGMSDARNLGLDISHGEYIGFVDSDDYIQKETYEIAYKAAKKDNIDVVEFQYVNYYERKKIKPIINNNNFDINGNIKEIKECWEEIKIEIWSKIYKNKFINKYNIRFVHDLYGEDFCFNLMVFPRIKKIKFIPGNFYIYRRRKGQLTKQNFLNKFKKMKKILYIIPKNWEKDNLIKGNEIWLLEILIYIYQKRGKRRYKIAKEFYNIIKEVKVFNNENINKMKEQFKNSLNEMKSFAFLNEPKNNLNKSIFINKILFLYFIFLI